MPEGEAGDRRLEMTCRLVELAARELLTAKGDVATRVLRIALQTGFPVEFGIARGVPVELEMLAGEIQFVTRSDVLGCRRFGGDFSVALGFGGVGGAVSNDRFAEGIENPNAQRGLGFSREVEAVALPRSIGRGGGCFVQNHAVVVF